MKTSETLEAVPAAGEEAPYLTPPRSGPSRPVTTVLGIVIMALLGTALFSVALQASSTGSGTPEGAVRKLVGAIENEDVLGALESLAPAERDAIRDPLRAITGELQRLDLLSSSLDLNKITGVDVSVSDLQLKTEALRDDLAAVRIDGGTATSRVNGEQLPLGKVAREGMGDEATVDEIDTESLAESPLTLVTVRHDGDWYVSIGYSIAEAARGGKGSVPAAGTGVAAKGADSPEAALTEVINAGANLDLRRVIELVDPGTGAALHDYAPLFLEEAEAAMASFRDGGNKIMVSDVGVEAKRDGSVARVKLTRARVEATFDGGDLVYAYDGKCIEMSGSHAPDDEDFPSRMCDGDEEPFPVNFDNAATFTAIERDGKWYIEPVRTMLDGFEETLAGLPKGDFESMVAAAYSGGAYFGSFGFFAPSLLGLMMMSSFGSVSESVSGSSSETIELSPPPQPSEYDFESSEYGEGSGGAPAYPPDADESGNCKMVEREAEDGSIERSVECSYEPPPPDEGEEHRLEDE